MSEFFQSEAFQNALDILIHQFPLAIWETVYVTILSTFFAVVIGLPLGVLLVAGEHSRILRIPQWILSSAISRSLCRLRRTTLRMKLRGFSARRLTASTARRREIIA